MKNIRGGKIMGTPEDVMAEKYSTPSTLTEMLRENLSLGHNDIDEHELSTIKGTFEKWLRNANIGSDFSSDLAQTRELLIDLVDEL